VRNVSLGGLTVSAQGLGCMGMSEWYGQTDWDESVATIPRALDLGVTFLDTADVYGAGHNEVLVGRALAGRREGVQLATKFGIDRSGGDDKRVIRGERGYVKRACESSLTRLGVDVIDLYYLHRPPQTAEIEETVGAMAGLVAEGKVRYLGLSEVDSALLRRAYAVHPIAAVQSEYSLWARDPETTVLDALRELGVGLVPYSPLGRGFLTGTVDVATLDAGPAGHPGHRRPLLTGPGAPGAGAGGPDRRARGLMPPAARPPGAPAWSGRRAAPRRRSPAPAGASRRRCPRAACPPAWTGCP
jgi:aryl-alcohol dehydrogenase-like predicted oxidoreductase